LAIFEDFLGILQESIIFAHPKKEHMAHHKSAKKRIRQSLKRRDRNRYYGKTTRNLIRKLRATTDKSEAEQMLTNVISMVDKLAKRNIIHDNKAANLKSKLTKHVNNLK